MCSNKSSNSPFGPDPGRIRRTTGLSGATFRNLLIFLRRGP